MPWWSIGRPPHPARPWSHPTRRSGSVGGRTVCVWPTRSTVAGPRWSSSRVGSATFSTTGRARSGVISSISSAASRPSSDTTSGASACPIGTSTTSRSRLASATWRPSSAAAGLERFALLGMSGGSAVAMAYAIAHPERVSRLILYGTVCGEPVTWSPDGWAEEETYRSMIRVGWAKEDPDFRRVFTRRYIPDATEEQMRWFDDLQRMSTSPANAVGEPDGPPAGGHRGRAPPDHRADDGPPGDRRPLDDVRQRRRGVRADPGRPPRPARESQPHPPRRRAGLERVHRRGGGVPGAGSPGLRTPGAGRPAEALSPREVDVLRLAAEGRTNEEIAAALTLSVRTVERHLSNTYAKLGLSGRAARAAAVAEYLGTRSADRRRCVSAAIGGRDRRAGLGAGAVPPGGRPRLRSPSAARTGSTQR